MQQETWPRDLPSSSAAGLLEDDAPQDPATAQPAVSPQAPGVNPRELAVLTAGMGLSVGFFPVLVGGAGGAATTAAAVAHDARDVAFPSELFLPAFVGLAALGAIAPVAGLAAVTGLTWWASRHGPSTLAAAVGALAGGLMGAFNGLVLGLPVTFFASLWALTQAVSVGWLKQTPNVAWAPVFIAPPGAVMFASLAAGLGVAVGGTIGAASVFALRSGGRE